MFANPTKIRFRRKALARAPLDTGIPSSYSDAGAVAGRGVVVRHQIGRPILVCRWVIVDGRLECGWSVEISEGSQLEEPKSSRWVHRNGRFFDVKRSRHRQAVPAAA
jgi:hypothetical protein